MKIQIVLTAVMSALLCGCGPDPRIAKQQEQITSLSNQIAELQTRLAKTEDNEAADARAIVPMFDLVHHNDTNSIWMSDQVLHLTLQAGEQSWRVQQITNYLGARFMKATALPAEFSDPTKYDQATGLPIMRPAANVAPGELPADVAAAIRADAERMYPTDYNMQLFHIKDQTEAWHKLNGGQ